MRMHTRTVVSVHGVWKHISSVHLVFLEPGGIRGVRLFEIRDCTPIGSSMKIYVVCIATMTSMYTYTYIDTLCIIDRYNSS